jgi:hypothetical protein
VQSFLGLGAVLALAALVGEPVSAVQNATPLPDATRSSAAPLLQSVASRKSHGAAGTFDLGLGLVATSPTAESRSGGASGNHTIVFTFDQPVISGAAAITEGFAAAGTPTFAGNEMIVPLSGVTDVQYVTVDVSNVMSSASGPGSGSVRIGFLLGDVNQNGVVTVADLGLVNAQLAQVVAGANYLKDVNASGTLTVADKGITNAKLTNALPAAICDSGLPSNSSDALQYAAAMDLCQTTTEAGTGPGLISAELTLSSGAGTPAAVSRAIRATFGTNNVPRAGLSMVVLSTGAAASTGQTNPSFVPFQPGLNTATSSGAPADWLAANGGVFPVVAGCPPASGTTAYNPVMLTLRIRVPSNAHSLRLSAKLFAADYPEYVCSPYNDIFVALLDSAYAGTPSNPADKNLATYTTPGAIRYPLNANLAYGNTGLFTQCVNGATGCAAGAGIGGTRDCAGTTALAGTGMDTPAPGSCAANSMIGGGTDWLVIRGNVVPGETITLRLALWDTSDGLSDSVILLDNFAWSANAVTPGVSLQ